MNVIILAGGYAERLWPLTQQHPKVLLPIAGAPTLCHLLANLSGIREVGQLQVAVDDAKEKFFAAANLKSAWTNPKAQLLLSVHSSNRDGSIKGPVVKLTELMDKCTEDVLVIGGDNVFGFDLNNFCSFYVARGKSCVAIQRLKQLGDVSSYGAPTLDNRGVVVSFVEKPLKTRYELVSTACYFLRKNDLERSREYLGKGGKDTLGEFTAWLAPSVPT